MNEADILHYETDTFNRQVSISARRWSAKGLHSGTGVTLWRRRHPVAFLTSTLLFAIKLIAGEPAARVAPARGRTIRRHNEQN